jgi:hypothetical protein
MRSDSTDGKLLCQTNRQCGFTHPPHAEQPDQATGESRLFLSRLIANETAFKGCKFFSSA